MRSTECRFSVIVITQWMLRHCRLGDRTSIRPVKKLGVGLLVVTI